MITPHTVPKDIAPKNLALSLPKPWSRWLRYLAAHNVFSNGAFQSAFASSNNSAPLLHTRVVFWSRVSFRQELTSRYLKISFCQTSDILDCSLPVAFLRLVTRCSLWNFCRLVVGQYRHLQSDSFSTASQVRESVEVPSSRLMIRGTWNCHSRNLRSSAWGKKLGFNLSNFRRKSPS